MEGSRTYDAKLKLCQLIKDRNYLLACKPCLDVFACIVNEYLVGIQVNRPLLILRKADMPCVGTKANSTQLLSKKLVLEEKTVTELDTCTLNNAS